MTKHKIFLGVCIGVLLGTGIGSLYAVGKTIAYVLLSCAVAILLFGSNRDQKFHIARAIMIGAWLVVGASFGLWRIQAELATPNQFAEWMGKKQDFEGYIVSEPDVRPDKQLLTVEPVGFSQRILVTTTEKGYFQYGDRVWVRGKAVEPAAFNDFDYPGYLARFNTFALSRYPKIIVLETGGGNPVVGRLLRMKAFLVQRLSQVYTAPTGNMLLGILIGAKKGLEPAVVETFNTTGTSHILAASGFNISIFLTGLAYIAYAIGRRKQLVVSLVCVLMFVVIAGPTASVLRAAAMGMLVLLSIASGRLYSGVPVLVMVAAFMVAGNPRILFWDVGFQLSVAATAGILLGMPLLARYRKNFGVGYKIVEVLGVTLCAIAATLPLTLLHFGRLSLVAPVVNMIIVPLVPFVMGLGALSFLPFVGEGFGWVNSHLLEWMLAVVRAAAGLRWASKDVQISGTIAAIAYCGLIGIYYAVRARLLHRNA